MEVAENPGNTYNPLFIYSSAGQGKTHLLHAIGHVAASNGLRVAYTSAEQFTSEFVLAIRQKQVENFRSKFRNIHTLLFDDIQFIANKRQTLQCFLHIFIELHSNNQQIVITADCHPQDMPLLSNKLKSRLECGLAVSIQPPDFETRLSILQAKAGEMMTPKLKEVLRLVAEKMHENVRQLEGAWAYLTAHAKLSGTELTPQIVNKLSTNITNKQNKGAIVQIVAQYFDLSAEELTGKKRDKRTSRTRQIAMYLMREESNYSFTEIGKELGGRNHATISHGYEKIANEMNINHKLYEQLSGIKEKINSSKLPPMEY